MAGFFRHRPDSVPYSEKKETGQGYDDARAADEARGSLKRGSYLAKRIGKRVEPEVEPIALEAELTQKSAMRPAEDPDDIDQVRRG